MEELKSLKLIFSVPSSRWLFKWSELKFMYGKELSGDAIDKKKSIK